MISIRIPCYNQPFLLNYCLLSIKNQSFSKYEIIIIDDNSSLDYKEVLDKFSELPIQYVKNTFNKGAIENMLYSMELPTKFDYVMVFHEDDLMQPNLLNKIAEILKQYPTAAFVGTYISFFDNHCSYAVSRTEPKNHLYIERPSELVRLILQGKPLGFGTIVYKKTILEKIKFDFTQFSVLGDRPMLIKILQNETCVIIPNELVAVYSHPGEDNRWKNLRINHIFNLYKFYKNCLKNNYKESDRKTFLIGSTHGIISSYSLLSNEYRVNKIYYFGQAYLKGLLSLKHLLLTNNMVRRFIQKIKIQ